MTIARDLQWWHGSLINWLLLNADKTQRDAAKHFGVTETYISTLMKADFFKLAFSKAQDRLLGKVQDATIEKLRGLTDATLDCLSERIARERDSMPILEVRETCEMALRASGYGSHADSRSGATTMNNVIVLTREDLAHARGLMQHRQEVIDVESSTPPLAATGI
jgi:hypothetical protein